MGGGYRRIGRLVAAMLAAAATPLLCATGADPEPKPATALPAGADAVVVVNRASEHRRTAAGRGLMDILESGGNLRETRRSWAALSKALGWSPDEAFDALLGHRVTVLLRGLDRAPGPDWALLTEVTPDSERRLRTRLAAVPRRSVGNLAVLCIEDGSCEIAVARSTARAAGEGRVTVLIGPGGGRLFDELAPTLLSEPVHGLAGESQRVDITCVVRRPSADGKERLIVVSAIAREASWRARILATPGALWELPAGRMTRWGDAPFRRIESDALLAVMTVEGSALAGTLSALPGFAGDLPALPGFLQTEPGGRAMIALHRSGDAPAERGPVFVSREDRFAPPGPSRSAAPSPLALSVALESPDLHRDVLAGDQHIALLVASLQRGERITTGPLRMEVGVGDHEPRMLPLGEMLEVNPSVRASVEGAFGPDPVLRWGVAAGHGGGDRVREQGWWYATLAPAKVQGQAIADLLGAAGEGALKRRISIGIIRPAELLRAAGGTGAAFLGPLQDYRSIESLRWDAWVNEDGMIEGDLTIGVQR